ncbi:VOC family protein [Geodermatophilus amargosae]|uniref:VOC family protein n=1 Tax=Geodermatophilus amargosae TaxID=1296565 RepID=UPI0034DEBA6A
MAVRLDPYLHFSGDAREATGSYRWVLGGHLAVMTLGDAGGPDRVSPSLSGGDQQTLARWFEALAADGGTVDVPFGRQVWGDVFGQVTDRFGIRWLVDAATPAV